MKNVNTSDLKAVLTRVAPALSSLDIVPVLTHFCFDSELGCVYAYDDVMALGVYSELGELNCAVPSVFLKLLSGVSVNAELSTHGDSVKLSFKGSGRKSTAKLPLLPSTVFIYEEPEQGDEMLCLHITQQVVEAITALSQLTGQDPFNALQMGVVLSVKSSKVSFYCTDNRTLTRFVLDNTVDYDDCSVVLPISLCNQIKSWYSENGDMELYLYKDHVWVDVENQSFKGFMFTKLPFSSEGCEVLADTFERHVKGVSLTKEPTQAPPELSEALEKCLLISEEECVIKAVSDDLIEIDAVSNMSEFHAEVEVEVHKSCPDVFRVSARNLYRGLRLSSAEGKVKMAFLDGCIAIKVGNLEHLVSIMKGK